jgi:hypothetical protein
MKRRSIKLLLFLLIGAIINGAVASACASFWTSINQGSKFDRLPTPRVRHPFPVPETWLSNTPEAVHQARLFGTVLTHSWYFNWPVEREKQWMGTMFQIHAGWPAKSFYVTLTGSRRGGRWEFETHKCLMADEGAFSNWANRITPQESVPLIRTIPTLPLLPGFAINTIFYAGIVWGLFAVSGAIRRRIGRVRRKRGQCAACGYSLRGRGSVGGGDKCPECGVSA